MVLVMNSNVLNLLMGFGTEGFVLPMALVERGRLALAGWGGGSWTRQLVRSLFFREIFELGVRRKLETWTRGCLEMIWGSFP